jgi:hypothetical protein
MRYYAGIGSRKTPDNILEKMNKIAKWLAKREFILRSGGADGADYAFECGASSIDPKLVHLMLPWKKFNANIRNHGVECFVCGDDKDMADIAKTIHPAWHMCSHGAKALHTRNVAQILGPKIDSPVDFVIAWTDQGMKKGGTRTAILLAEKNNIPVFNLFNEESSDNLKSYLGIKK